MARGDVRIAVTLACEDCKRRNYQTNKSKRNNPDRITLRKFCKWCRRHTGHREEPDRAAYVAFAGRPDRAILLVRPRAGAGFSFARRQLTTLGARLRWPAETSGSL